MSFASDERREIETLAWITDDEAEFWTSLSPARKSNTFNYPSQSRDFSSGGVLSDGLHFKSDDQLNPEMEDHLSTLYREGIENQVKDVEENAEKKQISEIFEFNDNNQVNENIPGISMSFLDRLFHQITRPSASDGDYISDEDFTEIDQSEITAVINDNIDKSWDNENKLKNDSSIKFTIQEFLEELNEETGVIRGILDRETLLNRRSRKAKNSLPVIEYNERLFSRTSF